MMNIAEEIQIDADVAVVYDYLMDFKKWSEWSPWIVCEPDCPLSFEANAYSWDGKIIGSGRLSLTDTVENQKMECELEFLKPWKSQANTQFVLSPADGGTKVTWQMQSSLPWFMFFLKSMMKRLISMDYTRGLKMLKQMLEEGKVDSKLEYNPSEQIVGCHYIGIQTTCSIDNMDSAMSRDFTRLKELSLKNKLEGDHAVPFTIYQKWKLGKGLVTYTCAIPIKDKLQNIAELPYETVSGYRPPCDAYTVTHTGDYQHLGNAWTSAMMRSRNKVFAQSKRIMPFELYITDPEEDGELITKVCIPLK